MFFVDDHYSNRLLLAKRRHYASVPPDPQDDCAVRVVMLPVRTAATPLQLNYQSYETDVPAHFFKCLRRKTDQTPVRFAYVLGRRRPNFGLSCPIIETAFGKLHF